MIIKQTPIQDRLLYKPNKLPAHRSGSEEPPDEVCVAEVLEGQAPPRWQAVSSARGVALVGLYAALN